MAIGWFSKSRQRQLERGEYFTANIPHHSGYIWKDENGKEVLVTTVTQSMNEDSGVHPDTKCVGKIVEFVRRVDVAELEMEQVNA